MYTPKQIHNFLTYNIDPKLKFRNKQTKAEQISQKNYYIMEGNNDSKKNEKQNGEKYDCHD